MKAISRLLAVLAVLLLTGCGEKDHPVRTSLVVDTSTMTLSIGESAVRMATSKAEDAVITYTSSNPAVATVDQFGKVTALTEGETTITITMDETKKSWYAASTIEYQVVVKNVSAKALEDVDKSTPLTLVAGEDGKIPSPSMVVSRSKTTSITRSTAVPSRRSRRTPRVVSTSP